MKYTCYSCLKVNDKDCNIGKWHCDFCGCDNHHYSKCDSCLYKDQLERWIDFPPYVCKCSDCTHNKYLKHRKDNYKQS